MLGDKPPEHDRVTPLLQWIVGGMQTSQKTNRVYNTEQITLSHIRAQTLKDSMESNSPTGWTVMSELPCRKPSVTHLGDIFLLSLHKWLQGFVGSTTLDKFYPWQHQYWTQTYREDRLKQYIKESRDKGNLSLYNNKMKFVVSQPQH